MSAVSLGISDRLTPLSNATWQQRFQGPLGRRGKAAIYKLNEDSTAGGGGGGGGAGGGGAA